MSQHGHFWSLLGLYILLSSVCYSKEFDVPEEDIELLESAEEPTLYEDLMEERFEINQRGAIYDSVTGKRRYDGWQLIRVNPQTDDHLDVLQFLEKGQGMVEMWSSIPYNASLVESVDMIVSLNNKKQVKGYLSCSGMPPTVVEEDLQRAIEEENIDNTKIINSRLPTNPNTSSLPYIHVVQKRGTSFGDLLRGFLLDSRPLPSAVRPGRHLPPATVPVPSPNNNPNKGKCSHTGMTWGRYHRYKIIDDFVTCLASEYPDLTQLHKIGTSYEGRDLHLLRISSNSRQAKGSIWIDGGIHAREWVSPSAVTFMMKEFLENPLKYRDILNKYDLFILPLANPDGYEYSHTKDRLWRKTRSNHKRFGCKGVDPNRNWGYHWGGQGASGDPCDETYYGPRPFSEPETAAIRNFIMARKDSMKLYLTFHSYGQYILYPWGYARKDTVDRRDLHNLGLVGARAARALNGRKYSVGTAAKMLYPAAGGSDDWAKGGAGIKYSYTIELPDTGRHGFLLPSNKAEDVGEEATALTVAMITGLK